VKEVQFEKVGVVVNDNADFIDVHKDTAVLRVKFTQRPRSVFHKQSDVMILVATIMKGSNVVVSCNSELIFRGGTGSIHSAEQRKITRKNELIDDSPSTHIIVPENYPPVNYQEGTAVITQSDFDQKNFMQDFIDNGGQKCVNSFQCENNITHVDFSSIFYQNMINAFIPEESQMMQMGYHDGNSMNYIMGENNSNFVEYTQNNSQIVTNENNIYEDDAFKSPLYEENCIYQEKIDPSLERIDNNPEYIQNEIPLVNSPNIPNNDNYSMQFNNMMPGVSFSLKGAKIEDGKWKADFEGFFCNQNFIGTMTGVFNSSGFQGNFDAKFN